MQHTITAADRQSGQSGNARSPVSAKGSQGTAERPDVHAQERARGRLIAFGPRSRGRKDLPARWLAVSMGALAVLSAAAAVVSFAAQYQMVRGVKGSVLVSALEAGIPDVAAVIFATLGIALALNGKRAIRARVLNLAAVGTSVAMNLLAAGDGWRDLAIWVMPPVAYALASDTAIGVVRVWTLARARALNDVLADDAATPLALVGGMLLWLLRLALAPASTLTGFRGWVIEECSVAPGRRASRTAGRPGATAQPPTQATASRTGTGRREVPLSRPGTKTRRFLDLVTERHGPLAEFPLADVSRVSADLAPQADLNPGAARSALRRQVQVARAARMTRPANTTTPDGSDENGSAS